VPPSEDRCTAKERGRPPLKGFSHSKTTSDDFFLRTTFHEIVEEEYEVVMKR